MHKANAYATKQKADSLREAAEKGGRVVSRDTVRMNATRNGELNTDLRTSPIKRGPRRRPTPEWAIEHYEPPGTPDGAKVSVWRPWTMREDAP